MIFLVEPDFYAELIESATRSDGNYVIENDNGPRYTAVKVVDNQISASDHNFIAEAVAWLNAQEGE
jgi:hypothetical protein